MSQGSLHSPIAPPPSASRRLPLAGLLALAMGGFITIMTETLPAGLLPLIGAGLSISRAWVGQLVTAYALGSLVAAIPLIAATRAMRRRRLRASMPFRPRRSRSSPWPSSPLSAPSATAFRPTGATELSHRRHSWPSQHLPRATPSAHASTP